LFWSGKKLFRNYIIFFVEIHKNDHTKVLHVLARLTNTKLGVWIFNPLFGKLMGLEKLRSVSIQEEPSYVPFVKPDQNKAVANYQGKRRDKKCSSNLLQMAIL